MTATQQPLRIDIVSDVVCPWCIVGFKQLEQALNELGLVADIHWQPFQLNPQMGSEGQDLREHVIEKYGVSVEESISTRERISSIGKSLNFEINFTDNSRIYNTFSAHKLLHWAEQKGQQNELKQALFSAYFTQGIDVSNQERLLEIVESVNLDKNEAKQILLSTEVTDEVNQIAQFWTSQGISGVPAMIFNQRHLVTGAQGTENYTSILNQIISLAQTEQE
ncbi:DsbA family oxidoreductase [Psychrosphaera aquimarina]|jgi:predicted DsbA family dithiol-disulfide isomerase|uniref:DsbA family oxidoreductase n=1 Tax=Psychrosphaera aquimarina TaxID=2044854 RepID=A0ABU3QVR8_9GAMM|nr:DsbA family oxidoreductase [Psychrosphaera aquimarina]MDU0111525.1 DsbA family oxidoreductase [Psychrosphaera aquimarina]